MDNYLNDFFGSHNVKAAFFKKGIFPNSNTVMINSVGCYSSGGRC